MFMLRWFIFFWCIYTLRVLNTFFVNSELEYVPHILTTLYSFSFLINELGHHFINFSYLINLNESYFTLLNYLIFLNYKIYGNVNYDGYWLAFLKMDSQENWIFINFLLKNFNLLFNSYLYPLNNFFNELLFSSKNLDFLIHEYIYSVHLIYITKTIMFSDFFSFQYFYDYFFDCFKSLTMNIKK